MFGFDSMRIVMIILLFTPVVLVAVNLLRSKSKRRAIIVSSVCLCIFLCGLFGELYRESRIKSLSRDSFVIEGGFLSYFSYESRGQDEEIFYFSKGYWGDEYYSLSDSLDIEVSSFVKRWGDVIIAYPKVNMPLEVKRLTAEHGELDCYILPEGTQVMPDLTWLWAWLMIIGYLGFVFYNAVSLVIKLINKRSKSHESFSEKNSEP